MSRLARSVFTMVAITLGGGVLLGIVLTKVGLPESFGPLVLVLGLLALGLALLKPLDVVNEELERPSRSIPHR